MAACHGIFFPVIENSRFLNIFIHFIYRLQMNYIVRFIFITAKIRIGSFADVRNFSLRLVTIYVISPNIRSASASVGFVPALGFLLAQKSCILSMPPKLNRFTVFIARGLMGLFLSSDGVPFQFQRNSHEIWEGPMGGGLVTEEGRKDPGLRPPRSTLRSC